MPEKIYECTASWDALPSYQISNEYLAVFYCFLLLSFSLRAFKMTTAEASELAGLESISLNLFNTKRLQAILKQPFWWLLRASQKVLAWTESQFVNTNSEVVPASQDTPEHRLILMRKLPLLNFFSALISQPIHVLWTWNHRQSPCEERIWCVTGLRSLEPKPASPGTVLLIFAGGVIIPCQY